MDSLRQGWNWKTAEHLHESTFLEAFPRSRFYNIPPSDLPPPIQPVNIFGPIGSRIRDVNSAMSATEGANRIFNVVGFGQSKAEGPRDEMILQPRRECRFCMSNGESTQNYTSHVLRLSDGTVICPILRRHCCEFCGATGDNAHTRNYCPQKPWSMTGMPVQVALKKTKRRSDGQLRK